ncbi:C-_U-editing enzyme APOBEC-1-like isoform X1 [Dermochelys coriacea]|uniref:C->U-editing enzyme APOBEC-1-like isoform X1 n=1 Tax=Dermochelys coriacea TaxID=27794 RepID=UPI001CAA1C9A|nr:C->U-editing enzyme APOBEC-1-like isoform X1 [Dermochelys coriacea]
MNPPDPECITDQLWNRGGGGVAVGKCISLKLALKYSLWLPRVESVTSDRADIRDKELGFFLDIAPIPIVILHDPQRRVSKETRRCLKKQTTDHVCRGITDGGKILQETFIDSYDPSVLRRVQYMLYKIKWSNSKRPWQSCCHSTRMEHAEIHFIEDVFQEQRSDPSVHCSITWYMSWSPCGDCCKQIRDFLKEQPNVNLIIYVARIYWHKEEINRQGLRSLMNVGVSIRVMDLPVYSYCWRTFVDDEDKYEDDYWPRHFAPWIMLYSLELQSILQNTPSCLEISTDENQTPIFSLCVEDDQQKRALTSANP